MGLAREGGLAAATVEAITERAGVSRRTFFNYYPTKEDALLGTTSPGRAGGRARPVPVASRRRHVR